jgi:hypothetical protein
MPSMHVLVLAQGGHKLASKYESAACLYTMWFPVASLDGQQI